MIGLTPKQSQVLDYIRHCFADSGVAPSYAEIGIAAGLSSKSGVKRLVDGLEERGAIRRLRGRARALEVVEPGSAIIPQLPDLQPDQLRQVLARTVGLLAEREGVPQVAIMLHRMADELPRGRTQ